MKVLFVYPEIQSSVTNTATYSLPLGLGAVATYCKKIFGDEMEIKILDGSMMTHTEQVAELEKFQPDFIGLSPTIASMGNAYLLASRAKELGAVVMFGGVNSTNLWRQMLKNRPFIDAIVLYEGEEAMAEILRRWRSGKKGDKMFRDTPNAAYRINRGEVIGPKKIRVFSLEELPDIDYSLFDLPKFFIQTEERGFGRVVSYYGGKGCFKRSRLSLQNEYIAMEYDQIVRQMKTCTFCGRNELGFRCLSPERECTVLHHLHDDYGARGFFNVQDTVNLHVDVPVGLDDSWFRLFIGAENITPKNIRRLQHRYGPHLIFQAGIETATPEMRRALGKTPITSQEIFAKVKLMEQKGIQLHASFIFGGRGETVSSLKATAKMAKQLADYPNVTWILISPQLILPGSPDYRSLLTMPGMDKKWGKEDLINLVKINRDFLRFFTPELTRKKILEEIKSVFAEIKKTGNRAVLDVKGVVPHEEEEIQPRREYCG